MGVYIEGRGTFLPLIKFTSNVTFVNLVLVRPYFKKLFTSAAVIRAM